MWDGWLSPHKSIPITAAIDYELITGVKAVESVRF
jgi:hypothetical protein